MKTQKSTSIALVCGLSLMSAIAMPAKANDEVAYEYGLSRIKVDSKSVTKETNIEPANGEMAAIEKNNRPKAIDGGESSFKTPKHNPRI